MYTQLQFELKSSLLDATASLMANGLQIFLLLSAGYLWGSSFTLLMDCHLNVSTPSLIDPPVYVGWFRWCK
jgi:hypothetical protein